LSTSGFKSARSCSPSRADRRSIAPPYLFAPQPCPNGGTRLIPAHTTPVPQRAPSSVTMRRIDLACCQLRLMRLIYLAGDRTAARRRYEQCIAALSEELHVRPTKATTALFERKRVDAGINAFVDGTRNDEHTSAVTADLFRLESLLFALSVLESQTKRCLLEIRRTLRR
jgi:hypothetical protein